jgi:hypothetical protein
MTFEKKVGVVGGWNYVIRRSGREVLFRLWRESLSIEDHGRKKQLWGVFCSPEEAEERARNSMRRVEAASGW